MKTLLTWLLSLACFAAGAQPTIRLASAQVFNRGAHVASGFGSCGTFTLQQFIRTSTADGTNAETTGGFDSTGVALEVINVAASNTAPITVYNASSNVWVAGRPVTNGTFVFQQFFCTNVIATNGDQFVAECTNASPVLQVYLFTCTGQPVFDGQSAGGGGSGSATYQPGSLTPFSGTELFVVGIGANEGYSSIDSSFASELGDTAGNVSIGTSYKNSSSAENPTLTLSASGTASASMLMFGSVNCSGSQPTGATFDWRLNGDLTDSSGNGNSGTLAAGTASYTTDEHGNATHALTFAGTSANTVVAMNNATAANVTSGDMTIYVKIKFTGSGFTDNGGQIQNIFTKGSFQVAGYTCDVHAALGGDTLAGHIEFASEQSGADQVIATSDRAVVLNTWYDLVIVKSGTTVTLSVYNSGTLVEPAATGTIVNPTSDTTDAFTIGGASGQLQAVVAQTAQWPFAFTGTQITALVNPTTGGSL